MDEKKVLKALENDVDILVKRREKAIEGNDLKLSVDLSRLLKDSLELVYKVKREQVYTKSTITEDNIKDILDEMLFPKHELHHCMTNEKCLILSFDVFEKLKNVFDEKECNQSSDKTYRYKGAKIIPIYYKTDYISFRYVFSCKPRLIKMGFLRNMNFNSILNILDCDENNKYTEMDITEYEISENCEFEFLACKKNTSEYIKGLWVVYEGVKIHIFC